MQIKNLKHVAEDRRLGFVTTGNRQKLNLKSRNWQWFQKGLNSEWTLEWRVWPAMGLLSHPWIFPQLGFSASLDSSVGWDMHIHLPPWYNRNKNLTTAEITKETFPIRAYSTQSCCFLALHWLVLSDRNQTWSYRITSMITWLLFLQMVKSRPYGLLSSSIGWSPHMVWWWWWWFSRSVMSDSMRPHGLQHARLPCPSVTDYPRRCLCLAASLLA